MSFFNILHSHSQYVYIISLEYERVVKNRRKVEGY
jgi:hypothetical protein